MSNKTRINNTMTEPSGEQISSLVDGEFDRTSDIESHLDYLIKDKELRSRWERYCLIADTLKRKLPPVIDRQLASRVMAELENEPTILAPRRINASFGKRIAGLAVAASVATVAVLGVQYSYKEDVIAPAPQIALIQGSKTQGKKLPSNNEFIHRDVQTVTQTVNSSDSSAQRLLQQHPSQIINEYHPNLNKYLLNHNQRASRGVVQGVMPYARIITDSELERITHQNQLKSQNQNQGQVQR